MSVKENISMSIYSNIYYKLCETKKQAKAEYKPFSGLHEHHILPKHSGGDDSESNLTYLTVREHIIAHYLLWKIYKNPNDLRAMKMLGANLTPEKRRIIGKWCRDNKIGFHGYSKEEKKIWAEKGLETQKNNNSKDSFYYWSTKEGRKERASLGGKASIKSSNNKEFLFWMSKEGRKIRASMGGKSHKDKKVMHQPGNPNWKRIKPEDIHHFLSLGWQFGVGETYKKLKSFS